MLGCRGCKLKCLSLGRDHSAPFAFQLKGPQQRASHQYSIPVHWLWLYLPAEHTHLPLTASTLQAPAWPGCVSSRLHPWVLALPPQEEERISWQAALGFTVSVTLSFSLFLSFLISQDIHSRTCSVPQRELAPFLTTPTSQIKSHSGRVVWLVAVIQDFPC